MIQVTELGRKFQDKVVLKEINLHINKGEFVTLKGKNGSGKTTLLRILATLTLPSWGRASVGGFCTRAEPYSVRKHLGWAPCSDIGFVPRFDGQEKLFFFGRLYGIKRQTIEDRLTKWASWETLQLALKTRFHSASSGMKQSLLVARAFLKDPDILLLDEPIRGLDKDSVQNFKNFLRAEANGKTIIIASHVDDFDSLASQTLFLDAGVLT